MMDEQLINDLKETRHQLEVRGRCRSEMVNDEGNVCLDGAIVAAINNNEVRETQTFYQILSRDPRGMAVTEALCGQVPDDHESFGGGPKSRFPTSVAVFYFNDCPTTTDADCFNLIDKAIAEAGGMA